MERFIPYLGAIAALIIAAALLSLFGGAAEYRPAASTDSPVATSTFFASSSDSVSSRAPVALQSETEAGGTAGAGAPAAAVPAGEVSSSPVTAMPAQLAAELPTTVQAPSIAGSAALDASAAALRAALVNIICRAPAGSGIHSMSGSGVFIDSKGIVVTNAHIAQYFLLADRGVSCDIRSGSPAVDTYDAALVHLPSAWVGANASVISEAAPMGTGERDFAFLAVTKSATSAPLPSPFPHIPLAAFAPSQYGASVVIASYGAQFLAPGQIQSALFPTVVFGSVKDVFTFASSTVDVLALGGSAAAQEGSSGGGVVDASGALTGVITTSTIEGATDTRKLDAITAAYIRAEYARETGQSLDTLLAKSVSEAVTAFAPHMPALESLITAHLP